MTRPSVVIFGATGAIGQALVAKFVAEGADVVAVSRAVQVAVTPNVRSQRWSGGADVVALSAIAAGSVDAVVWAQGMNFSDDIHSFDLTQHQAMYEANVTYILNSLQALLKNNCLAPAARLCVISSIWQNQAKQNKMSYCITKSALQGLVQSLAVDLGPLGHMMNAVLPGALDTPMTRANLSAEQVTQLESMTPLGSLASLEDVCNLVAFLCSKNNTGITGQFVAADRGFSNARII
jgi:NAD(P)-dependent dehydrogenase (short-subunit alcohol dehydrogenase family)